MKRILFLTIVRILTSCTNCAQLIDFTEKELKNDSQKKISKTGESIKLKNFRRNPEIVQNLFSIDSPIRRKFKKRRKMNIDKCPSRRSSHHQILTKLNFSKQVRCIQKSKKSEKKKLVGTYPLLLVVVVQHSTDDSRVKVNFICRLAFDPGCCCWSVPVVCDVASVDAVACFGSSGALVGNFSIFMR